MIKTWFAGGEVESEVIWKDGAVVSGQRWFESGDLKEKGAAANGLFEAWYEGGQIMQRGELKETTASTTHVLPPSNAWPTAEN